MTNSLYESHRHSKKNAIYLNKLLRHENPCQTEFILIEELHTKKVMEYRQKLQKFVIGTQFSSFPSISSIIEAKKSGEKARLLCVSLLLCLQTNGKKKSKFNKKFLAAKLTKYLLLNT